MAIDKRSSEPSYLQLAALLRAQIADGTYQRDDRLPSVKKLCAEHGLSIDTVTHAISVLEEEGLVVAVQGRGTYVR